MSPVPIAIAPELEREKSNAITALRVYNHPPYNFPRNIMEAEQINQIVHRLADIGQRAAELRRYL
jgi:hypothetical protein